MEVYGPMLREFVIFALAAFLLVLAAAPTAEDECVPRDIELERQKIIILQCESSCRHEGVWGDGGRAYGIAQFHEKTFNAMKKMAGRPGLNWRDKDDQLWLFDWALRNGHAHNWTCARWLAAEIVPAFAIKKAHALVKGSELCPTRQKDRSNG